MANAGFELARDGGTFDGLDGDVDDVVVEAAAVGEAGNVAGEHAEVVRARRRRHRHVEAQHLRRLERNTCTAAV